MNELPDPWEQQVRDTARHFPYPPTPDVAARFQRRHPHQRRSQRLRVALVLLTVLALFGVVAVPDVRAGITEFFQIGSVRIWQRPPKPAATASITGTAPGELVTLEEAQNEVWYAIRLPSYPDGLGAPDEIYLLNPNEDGLQFVWYATADYPELRLTQFGNGFWVNKWGPTFESATPSTRVNGQYAVWAPGPHVWSFVGTDGQRAIVVPEGNHVLIWAEQNVTYRLESSLTEGEAIKVAESLP